MSDQHLTDIEFSSLALDASLLAALDKLKFKHCTPIQAESIPLLLDGKDVSGQAQTGTGKTMAFLLACAQKLLSANQIVASPGKPRALILAPTRELALQIHTDASALLVDVPLKLAICYGGKAYEQQKQQFDNGVDILIGTPGRLIDFFKQKLTDYNWNEITSVRSSTSVLTYSLNKRIMTIQIAPIKYSNLYNSNISITMSPSINSKVK